MSIASTSRAARRQTIWNLRPSDPQRQQRLAAAHGLHPVTARVLSGRGWEPESDTTARFLQPMLRHLRDPFELAGMDAAVERTLGAVARGEKICIYGDYDVDGVCASALMAGALRLLGAAPRIFIPHRLNDGYGMSVHRVEEIATDGYTLILTVDTGVSAIEPVRRAQELGVDVVITDHHLPSDALPEAVAFVNPNMPDCLYEHGRLCGTGVAFKFAHALLRRSPIPESDAKRFLADQLDLLALGTIADVVPLLGENRIFARHGLDAVVNTRRPGLRALLEVAAYRTRNVTPELVAFGLGPRLNAAGRTDDAARALELLLTNDAAEAKRLAQYLDHLNRERQHIERDILEASIDEVEAARAPGRHALVVGGEGWHLGVVGIVAARLTERYDVPAIVLAIESDLAKGSARSVPGFDIYEALGACEVHLETFGGHAAAAGLRLRTSSLPAFRDALNGHAAEIMTAAGRTIGIDVDSEVAPAEFDWDMYRDIQRLQPFGEGNPVPLLMMRGVRAVQQPRVVGRDHLRLRLGCGGKQFDAIGFSRAHLRPVFDSGAAADVLFRPRENTFNGYTSLEMELADARPAMA